MVITDADFDGDNIIYTIENSNLTDNQSFEDVSLFVDNFWTELEDEFECCENDPECYLDC